jgi:phosphoglycerate dehydrogenase-like enzyme
MVKVICTYTLKEELLDRINQKFGDKVEVVKVKDFDKADQELLSQARVLLTNQLEIDQKNLEKMKNLKWIQCVFSGINHFPLDYLKNQGIILTNAKGVHRIQMSEFIVSLLLSIVRKSYHYTKAHLNRKWDPLQIDELYGKTIGFIGVGAIARETARKLKAFDVRIIGVKNRVEDVQYFDEIYGSDQLNTLLEESDFVVTLVPLTEQTKKMIGEEQFRKMKKTAWFINVARGPVVDEQALIKALGEGWIAGAGLDVFEKEPLPEDSPIWDMDNVLLTPHTAGPTPYYMDRLMDVFIENLEAYVSDSKERMVNVIDYDKQY